ncbi:MAG: peroxiredoxin [Gammaproteobacteria bacterium]|nr:peroxiredoxin [Gammaproteobacteria bacterium]
MVIKTGDKVPAGTFAIMKKDGPGALSTDELFKGKKVVMFSVPGAFTPTCSKQHLPGFVNQATALKKKGIDTVACMSVNDVFVMDAWGMSAGAGDKVLMLADGNGDYAKALGLSMDASGFGMGLRAQRFSMLVDNGVVKQLNLEESPAQCTTSSAEYLLGKI